MMRIDELKLVATLKARGFRGLGFRVDVSSLGSGMVCGM